MDAMLISSLDQEVFVPATDCNINESLCFFPEYNFLVSWPVLIGGHVAYLLIVVLLRGFMAKRAEPYSLKGVMMVYNIVQVGMSTLMTIGLLPFLQNNFFNIDGKYCRRIEFWIMVHYVTKFLDMFDSFFMVLRKKSDQLSFLHLYHHMTIGLIWGLLLHFGVGNGTAFFGAWINSLVHALMYFHYLWTSLGFVNPFKKYLTMFQMFQFSLCILQAVLVLFLDNQISTSWAVLQLCYHMTLLYLFNDFLQKSQKQARADKKAALSSPASSAKKVKS
jgi:hypothetical protein